MSSSRLMWLLAWCILAPAPFLAQSASGSLLEAQRNCVASDPLKRTRLNPMQ